MILWRRSRNADMDRNERNTHTYCDSTGRESESVLFPADIVTTIPTIQCTNMCYRVSPRTKGFSEGAMVAIFASKDRI